MAAAWTGPVACSFYVLYASAMWKSPNKARKGRGAVSNRTGRFEPEERIAVDDGWGMPEVDNEEEPSPLRTTLYIDKSRKAITRNNSPDIGFDRSINPYKGCEHGCIYCYARPTHAYLGLSPGLDFETKIFHKPDAPEQLARELSQPGYRPEPIMLGANTDPYQPAERYLELTRRILETLAEFQHPVQIITKSDLILRDRDILGAMAEQGLAKVAVSVTTLDSRLGRLLEPRAPVWSRRLAAICGLSEAGVPTAVMSAPVIPALNDSEMEAILEAAAEAGARGAGYVLLRLPLEIADLFREWLEEHFPDRAAHVLSLVRQTREGSLYQSEWGTRMKGSGPYADLIRQRFQAATRRLGLNSQRRPLDVSLFRVPDRPGAQLSLFR